MINYHSLPKAVHLFKSITTHLDPLQTLFSNKKNDLKIFANIIYAEPQLNLNKAFYNNQNYVLFLQLCMLLSLSMYGGIYIPCIKSCKFKQDSIQILWENNIKDTFNFGQITKNFLYFSLSFQNRLSSKKLKKNHLPNTLFQGMYQFIYSYQKILIECKNRFEKLIHKTSSIQQLCKTDDDLIFLIISSLPCDLISSMLLHIQNYFPSDLMVKSPSGHTMKICELFHTPTTDYQYLMEKLNIYLELYYNHQQPIIKEITQQKTLQYIQDLLKNEKTNQFLKETLQQTKEQEIVFRLNLINIFANALDIITQNHET